jgi:phosphohistidine swiveling domain-containing protein
MQSLWASGGSVDLASESLGLSYPVTDESPAYPSTLFGKLYVDKRQEHARALVVNALNLRRLKKSANAIETTFREHFLPEFNSEITLLEAADFDRLAPGELLDAIDRIRKNFVSRTQVEVSIVNIAASFFLMEAKKKLVAAGLDPVVYLAPATRNAFERALSEAHAAPAGDRNAILLKGLGHRAVLDYELSARRYAEKPAELQALLALPVSDSQAVDSDQDLAAKSSEAVLNIVRIARRFETLKEDAKHHALREVAVLRRAIVALDRQLKLDGLAFFLTFPELASLRTEAVDGLRAVAAERKLTSASFAVMPPLPSKLTLVQIEDASAGLKPEHASRPRGIEGTRVAGRGVIEGRACVVRNDLDADAAIAGFRDGDIVVSTMVPASWIPYFGRAGGFVCEVGGWLSHTAIVARELNTPLIVNTNGLEYIADGMQLRLHPNGGIEIVVQPSIAEAAE